LATSAGWNAAGEILIGMTTDIETGQQLDAAFEPAKSRYVIGIDLGTTNCAVAYMDTQSERPTVEQTCWSRGGHGSQSQLEYSRSRDRIGQELALPYDD